MRDSVQTRPAAASAPDARGLTTLLQTVLKIVSAAAARQGIDSKAVIEEAVKASAPVPLALDAREGGATR